MAKQVFKSEDGQEFLTEEEARKHDKVLKAQSDYRDAQLTYHRALLRSLKTADGAFFDFGLFNDYYYVDDWGMGSLPYLNKVHFHGWNFQLDEADEAGITMRDGTNHRWFRISDLYVSKHEAQKALLKRQEEVLADLASQVNRLRQELGQ